MLFALLLAGAAAVSPPPQVPAGLSYGLPPATSASPDDGEAALPQATPSSLQPSLAAGLAWPKRMEVFDSFGGQKRLVPAGTISKTGSLATVISLTVLPSPDALGLSYYWAREQYDCDKGTVETVLADFYTADNEIAVSGGKTPKTKVFTDSSADVLMHRACDSRSRGAALESFSNLDDVLSKYQGGQQP